MAPLQFRVFLILGLVVQRGSVAQLRDLVLLMTEVIEFIKASAQQLPVTSVSLEEDLRYLQVLGQLSKDVSLTVRPIMPEKHFFSDSFYYRIDQKKSLSTKRHAPHLFKEGRIFFLAAYANRW